MPRVKRGNVARKRRKKVLKATRGFQGALSKLFRPAHQSYLHALVNSYRDRRLKKRSFRNLWVVRIGAGLREHGISYSVFMGALKKKNIELDRKVLAQIALENPSVFGQIVAAAKK